MSTQFSIFLQLCHRDSFNGSAFELLEITQSIEKKLGRVTASIRNAPRVIDIDLLYFGDEIIDSENLILPHPRITERSFVLQPLAEIRGDFIYPITHRPSPRLCNA
ncbi:MAG: 2-amino-4-hydroxy-6-hydroxymethyldihydropteridine diphosphokinase [Akkermansiaceae bacterium]|nr:2-amino-4-hydroxy-6-hydroxymethyldihydropteridine diphosphokinase [Akkermansiaceae bacterium]